MSSAVNTTPRHGLACKHYATQSPWREIKSNQSASVYFFAPVRVSYSSVAFLKVRT